MTIYNKKMYRVDGIEFGMRPASLFTLKNGDKLSFSQYYEKQYNSRIRDPD